MEDVTARPAFIGQLSVEQERKMRSDILNALQRYAHGTGCEAGGDVIEWYRNMLNKHTGKPHD